jgi:hypothetical protein
MEDWLRMRGGYHLAPLASMDAPDMRPPTDPPPELIPVPMKGAVLLLTQAEFTAGVRRGKWWRRQVAMLQRGERWRQR